MIKNDKPLYRLLITPGEPAGIGPDLAIGLAEKPNNAELVLVADPALIEQRALLLGKNIKLQLIEPAQPPQPNIPGVLKVIPVQLQAAVVAGQLNSHNGRYVLACLDKAVAALKAGYPAALVTGPVHKGIINQAGIPFSGHTEYLTEITSAQEPVMMLATEGLRVALLTTHLPLAKVAQQVTPQRLELIIRILQRDLQQRFGIKNPKIAVCGLNPHAGEDGHLGREELDIMIPVMEKLKNEGVALRGPLPADTLFIPKHLEWADVVLAMYHDQGLPVLKYRGFGRAVNVTLGLPIIRTSVDHGTALELAATGKAEGGSLDYAIQVALEMVEADNAA
ncbi:MAG: 4-hydroxythreonine-4-phosphate dehydrogenase PdxA [Gammaproteobacteria bacterium]|nr:4-hydroxythreonine-4-phosphate dehydrogenase PdxA [Gammaproteobacteria bacterium]MCF6230260.1 4-hydroxythreonine-4-phosphate dehydrogenase PdxA [Gammaproteobacteria bacterium]